LASASIYCHLQNLHAKRIAMVLRSSYKIHWLRFSSMPIPTPERVTSFANVRVFCTHGIFFSNFINSINYFGKFLKLRMDLLKSPLVNSGEPWMNLSVFILSTNNPTVLILTTINQCNVSQNTYLSTNQQWPSYFRWTAIPVWAAINCMATNFNIGSNFESDYLTHPFSQYRKPKVALR